jgi:hypothetical protein
MRVVVTKKNGEKFAFRVEGLDSQRVAVTHQQVHTFSTPRMALIL